MRKYHQRRNLSIVEPVFREEKPSALRMKITSADDSCRSRFIHVESHSVTLVTRIPLGR